MMEKTIELLQKLRLSDKPMPLKEGADFLDVSTTKFKEMIKDLNLELQENGAMIVGKTGRGNGYTLEVNDDERFDEYIRENMQMRFNSQNRDFSQQEVRVDYIINRLFQQGDYIKSEELADELCVSRGQFSKDLNEVRKKLEDFHIRIESKPYYGIKVKASEMAIRSYIVANSNRNASLALSTSFVNGEYQYNPELAMIRSIVVSKCNEFGYALTDLILQNLVTHIFIAIRRAAANHMAEFSNEHKEEIRSEAEYELSKAIIEAIDAQMKVHLSEDEVYYCTVHLCGKKLVDSNHVFTEELNKLLDKIFLQIYLENDVDFRNDLKMRSFIGLHMIALLSRIKYNLELRNPLLNEIKTKYFYAYDLATTAAQVINRKYRTILSDHEISYLAVHMMAGLQDLENEKKYNVLLVCSTGRGSARLLQSKIEKQFARQIKTIKTIDSFSVSKMNLDPYDFIYTTVPLDLPGKNVIMISHFLNDDDISRIDSFMNSNSNLSEFFSVFRPELFIKGIKSENKEEILRIMTDNIDRHVSISDEFYDSVLEREELANTCFADLIAFPHPLKILSDETFISIGILEKPIEWDGRNNIAQMILLGSLDRRFARDHAEFYDILTKLISNKRAVRELIKAENYDEWCETVKKYI